jgi:hypothetical protein
VPSFVFHRVAGRDELDEMAGILDGAIEATFR